MAEVMESTAMVVAQPSVEALIVKAIEHNVSVEALERLLTMRERLKAEQAREAFFEALSAFQAECPVIRKRRTAGQGNFTYRYAPLEDIVATVVPLLRQHGLSYRFDTRFEDNPPAQAVRCIVNHRDGHTEESEFRTPVDAGARMNEMQKSASAQTYAKRYAFCNAFGILTGDDDNDGHTGGSSSAERQRQSVVSADRNPTDRGGDRPVGGGGEPAAAPVAPQPVTGRNIIRIAREAPPPEDPANTPDSRVHLRQECVDLAGIIESRERIQRGQEVPPIDVLLPIAGGRCDAWLSKAHTIGTNLQTATAMELTGLMHVLKRQVDALNKGAA